MSRPIVSVVVPVFNGEAFLAGAVRSIQGQTRPPDEIIVVDDGSSDGTAAVAAHVPGNVRYLHQANAGPPAARNAGLGVASGDVIGMLDADDLWPAERLASLLARLAEDPALDVVLGRFQIVGSAAAERPIEPLAEPVVGLFLGSALFRRSAFDRVGLFDPLLRLGDDLDWFLRAKEQGVHIAVIEAVTLLYRLHGANTTHDRGAVQRGIATALHRSLGRRRGAGGEVAPLPAIPGCAAVDDAVRRTIAARRYQWAHTARGAAPPHRT